MTSTTAIAKMPSWPRRMQRDMAAAYCGVSVTKFNSGVRNEVYPEGVKDGGNILWYIEDLDDALNVIKFVTGGASSANDADAWMKSLLNDQN